MATTVEDKSVLGLDNPMGTDGFEFVEYTAPDTTLLRDLFTKMGFPAIARHKRKDVTLHRQGEINFIINAEAGSYAEAYARDHGPSACAMAFRVKDAKAAFERAVRLGATPVNNDIAHGEMDIPAIEGIGGSRLFFVDTYGDKGSIYEVDFDFYSDAPERLEELDSHLTYIDHLTHNVQRGRMKVWADFYEKLFNFREIRYFDIEG
jgi:4-hydroxyphenylpyruvate dioxygenase